MSRQRYRVMFIKDMESFNVCTWLLFVSSIVLNGAYCEHTNTQFIEYIEDLKAHIEKQFDAKLAVLEAEIVELKQGFMHMEDEYKTVIEHLNVKLKINNGDTITNSHYAVYGNASIHKLEEENAVNTETSDDEMNTEPEMRRNLNQENVVKSSLKDHHIAAKRQTSIEGGSRIAFFASLTSTLSNLGASQDIAFDNVVTNLGSSYNGHHGIFIAPVAGTYVFHTCVQTHNTWGRIVVNGHTLANLDINDQTSQLIIIHLNVGDDVSVHSSTLGGQISGHTYSTFSGFLLYEDLGTDSTIIG